MEPIQGRNLAQDGMYGEPTKFGPPATPAQFDYQQDLYGSREGMMPVGPLPHNTFLQYGQEFQPKIYDNSLLSQAQHMQQQLADAGTAAVQQMQMNSMAGLGTQQGWQMQTMQQRSMTPPL